MTKDEALRMAIELLEDGNNLELVKVADIRKALKACKEALAQPTTEQSSLVQEPIYQVWQPVDFGGEFWSFDDATKEEYDKAESENRRMFYVDSIPLYTTPPSREWQSLSDDEITHIGMSCQSLHQVARATEAKLKAKNG